MANFDPLGDRHGPSGHWSGHYHHDTPSLEGQNFPIHATLWEISGRVEGVMSDDVTNTAYSLRKVVDNAQSMGQADARVFSELLRRHPNAIIESTLPMDSVIRGWLRDDIITFTKTYDGAFTARYRDAGSTFASAVRRNHRVYYSGTFDAARGVIEGSWEIRRPGLFGRFLARLATGTFSLAREDG